MGKALFYQLSRSPVEVTVPMILTRALAQGWRVVVRGRDDDRMARLDAQLWAGADDGFLPHGLAGGPHDDDQPVLLTTRTDPPPDMACLMAVDGAPVDPAECASRERVWILFDGNDDAALATARSQWSALTGAGLRAEYWSEDKGHWQKVTER